MGMLNEFVFRYAEVVPELQLKTGVLQMLVRMGHNHMACVNCLNWRGGVHIGEVGEDYLQQAVQSTLNSSPPVLEFSSEKSFIYLFIFPSDN